MSRLLTRAALWLDSIARDVRYSLRTLARTPAFTTAAILTLGLGIGANTAIFSLIETVMLRTTRVADPDRLVIVAHGTGDQQVPYSNYPFFERVRSRTDVFDGVTTYIPTRLRVALDDSVQHTPGQVVAGNYHAVLGVPMALGRGFETVVDRAGPDALVAVISHAYWQQKFGGAPDVLGKTVWIEDQPVSIVGVTDQDFHGLDHRSGIRVDVTVPFGVQLLNEPDFLPTHNQLNPQMPIVARLAPGATEAQARAAVEAVAQQYSREPEAVAFRDLKNERRQPTVLWPAARTPFCGGSCYLFAPSLRVLMGVVGIVLLIGCANVAALVLARAAARMKDVVVRLSIGGRRSRIIRQLLTESLIVATGGGALGFLIAFWAARLAAASLSGGENARLIDVQPNSTVMAFTAAVCLFTVIVFGLYPAYRATRVDLALALKESGINERKHSWWGGKALVIAQISLSLVLVVGAGLLVRSFFNLAAIETGVDRTNLALFSLEVEPSSVKPEQLPVLCDQLLARLRARSGASAASCSTSVPVHDSGRPWRFTIPSLATPERRASFNHVTSEYFATFGLELLRGRALAESDAALAPSVAVVNDRLAREYFGDADPIGRTLRLVAREPREMTIVGVVADALYESTLRDAPPPMVYTPLTQQLVGPFGRESITVGVRSTEPLAALAAAARAETRTLSGSAVVNYVRTMQEQFEESIARERVLATLSSWFGALALALTCVGLYGVVAHDVAGRRREFGVRLALGARPAAVTRDTLWRGALLAAGGLAVGLAGAFGAARLLGNLLYGIDSADPLVLGAAVAALMLTALLASYLPARRASRISPAEVLRAE